MEFCRNPSITDNPKYLKREWQIVELVKVNAKSSSKLGVDDPSSHREHIRIDYGEEA